MQPAMWSTHFRRLLLSAPLVLCVISLGCKQAAPANPVVLYTTMDGAVIGPIIEEFQKATGIHVIVRADAGSDLLISERAKPQADVWWSDECCRTICLADSGLLAA